MGKNTTETNVTKHTTKHQCVCTCCNERNISHDKCVIFVKKNYNFGKSEVSNALRRYREKNKEFICKECHTKLRNIDANTKFCVNTKTIQKKVYIKEQNVVNQVITTDTSETIQQKCMYVLYEARCS